METAGYSVPDGTYVLGQGNAQATCSSRNIDATLHLGNKLSDTFAQFFLRRTVVARILPLAGGAGGFAVMRPAPSAERDDTTSWHT